MNTNPIRELIARLTKSGLPGERAQLDEGALGIIRTAIHARIGQDDLMDCVEMVLAVADVFTLQLASPTAAGALVALVNDVDVVDALVRINEARRREQRVRAEACAQVGATAIERSAPRIDQARPAGTLRLQDLHRPRRLG